MTHRRNLRRLAIVNRSEPAMRCIRAVKTFRELENVELECVAFYTDVDRDASFVRHADRAVRLPSPDGPVQAYLDYDGLIRAIQDVGADSVWPGWGFLSEDPEFVSRLDQTGICFLGPPADVMRSLGDKICAKQLAVAAGVPVIPWSGSRVDTLDAARDCAKRVGFPLVVKASAGGGGRGIRIVETPAELPDAFRSAAAEAKSAFGDDTLFIEKKLPHGRHIEVQIVADMYGHVIALGCRDCSVQRRHQKVLEETPPPNLPTELLQEIEDLAVRLATQAEYRGVGTVEFLVSENHIYFLEVNPRLQVEHGITEAVTGIDLIHQQIRIAQGEVLSIQPNAPGKFALEARVCAEDPATGFQPSPGRIVHFAPCHGPGIRIDTDIVGGAEIPAAFDSLIAKVIASGQTREEAHARLLAGLKDFELVVQGGTSNKGFLIHLLDHPTFRAGRFDTEWLDQNPALRDGSDRYLSDALIAAAILSYQRNRDAARRKFLTDPGNLSPNWIPASTGQQIQLTHSLEEYRLDVFAVGAWKYRVYLDGKVVHATLLARDLNVASLEREGRALRVLHDVSEQGIRIEVESHPYRFGSDLAGYVRAQAPARVTAIHIAKGDHVVPGQSLGLLEAMKMEIAVQSPIAGQVKEVRVQMGQQVSDTDLLVIIEPDATDSLEVSEPASKLRIEFPAEPDPLETFFRSTDEAADLVPDLSSAAGDTREHRLNAIDGARNEIRRVLMGYDLNPQRCDLLLAILNAEVPDDLPETFRLELSELRHELQTFVDIERLFVKRPQASIEGELGFSNHAHLRKYMRRIGAAGEGVSPNFRILLEHALAHYGVTRLEPSAGLERGLLRLLASQQSRDRRLRLVLGITKLLGALAASGLNLEADQAFHASLIAIAGLRGLVSDSVADLAIETAYTIFNRPVLEKNAMGRADRPDSIEAIVARLYVPHVSNGPSLLANTHPTIECFEFDDGRTVWATRTRLDELSSCLNQIGRLAQSIQPTALELFVDCEHDIKEDELASAVLHQLHSEFPFKRLCITLQRAQLAPQHLSFLCCDGQVVLQKELHGIHPETAARVGLERLQAFDLERLDAPEDLFCFHLRSKEVPSDERIFVLADIVGGTDPDTLLIPEFEHAFFEAARTLRHVIGERDPRRQLQWNRIFLAVASPVSVDAETTKPVIHRLAPAVRHLGLEKVVVRVEQPIQDGADGPIELVIADPTGAHSEVYARSVHHAPLEPAQDYERKLVRARRHGLIYPYEIIRMLTGGARANGLSSDSDAVRLPTGQFQEYDLDPESTEPRLMSVADRNYGQNTAGVVVGLINTPTPEFPSGIRRMLILSDPTQGMGALSARECDRIQAAIDLAERNEVPVEWVPISSGARIAMDSGTENLDATARVVRRIIEFTEAGGTIHILVSGVNVGAQSYFNALATMHSRSRGALIMTPAGAMVLTGRAALEASGSVSAEDEVAIGGFERVMGPNGEAQYYARSLFDAYQTLYEHYRFTYVASGTSRPSRTATADPRDRNITEYACEPNADHGFERVGDIFSASKNPERKCAFAMRDVMRATVDQDAGYLERWLRWQDAGTTIVWDTRLGGHAISLIGIESQPLPREGYASTDGPSTWSGGTLFPLSSKKLARAINAASGNRPAVILANLSGFDGSPESMRALQLEYGAEIARAVVNFKGPLLFTVVSRYHGGAYVVFSRELNSELRATALTGSFASVIGGGPAAAVVFHREVRARMAADQRIRNLRTAKINGAFSSREELDSIEHAVRLEKQAEVATEFDRVHTVERALKVGSLEAIVSPENLRAYLIDRLDETP